MNTVTMDMLVWAMELEPCKSGAGPAYQLIDDTTGERVILHTAELRNVARALTDRLAAAPEPPAPGVGLHPATRDLVDRFAVALAEKLAAAEQKYGYSDGWASPDWMDECRAHLRQHVEKGDPRDVAAYCAFLWHHGESTAALPPASPGGHWVWDTHSEAIKSGAAYMPAVQVSDEAYQFTLAELINYSGALIKRTKASAPPAAPITVDALAKARYFADGPGGHFFADDLALTSRLVTLIEHDLDQHDEWTVTDLRNPTGGDAFEHPAALESAAKAKGAV